MRRPLRKERSSVLSCFERAVLFVMLVSAASGATPADSWVSLPPESAQITEQSSCWIVAGSASMKTADYKRFAKRNACWRAVQADLIRQQVPSDVIEKNAARIHKIIELHDGEIAPEQKLIEDTNTGDEYFVRMRIGLLPKILSQLLFIDGVNLEEFYRWWHCPSFLVGFDDFVEKQVCETKRTQIFIQDELLKHKFDVKNDDVLNDIRKSNAAIYGDDNKKIYLSLARKRQSEILVWGSCNVVLREKQELEGQPVYAYDCSLKVEVIDASNASIIVSKEWFYHASIDEKTTAFSKDRAIEKSQMKLLELNTSSIIYEILFNCFEWKITYELKFLNVKPSDRKKILNLIKATPGVEFLADEFDGAVMDVKIKYADDSEKIINTVENILGFNLERKSRGVLVFSDVNAK
jgi:hypothetical protein